MRKALSTVLLVLTLDQASKIWVKTHMFYNEVIPVIDDLFLLHFIENPGMAFGMEFGGNLGKLLLTLFRLAAVGLLGWGLWRSVQKKAPTGLIIALSLIIAGALGNIIDSMFYGVIFDESTHVKTAELFPSDGGYASFMYGRVVDMLHFPLIEGRFPEWFPFWGGDPFMFFRPVFNIADSAITIGIAWIIVRQRKFLGNEEEVEGKDRKNGDAASDGTDA